MPGLAFEAMAPVYDRLRKLRPQDQPIAELAKAR